MILGEPLYFALLIPTVILYYLLRPGTPRLLFLLLASYAFYATFRVAFLVSLLEITAIAYFGAIGIESAKSERGRAAILTAAIVVCFAPLVTYKYLLPIMLHGGERSANWQYTVADLVLPVGLSFYTFVAVGYLADVFLELLPADRNPLRVALMISFFAHLTAGPIARATKFLPQLVSSRPFDDAAAMRGVREMLIGVAMKFWIADTIGVPADAVYSHLSACIPLEQFVGTVFFAFQIYADFAGYSLIAIGTARLFGIELLPNFREPYLSPTIPEFWRCWHMSLVSWLRDYVFMPLQMRWRATPKAGAYAAIFITLVLVGVWHGAGWGFVAFGAVHGLMMIWSTATLRARNDFWARRRVPKALVSAARVPVTFVTVVLTMVLLRTGSLHQAFEVYRGIFSTAMLRNLANNLGLIGYTPTWGAFSQLHWEANLGDVMLVLLVVAGDLLARSKLDFERLPYAFRGLVYGGCTAVILYQLIGYNAITPFVYFQF